MDIEPILRPIFEGLQYEDMIIFTGVILLWWIVYTGWFFFVKTGQKKEPIRLIKNPEKLKKWQQAGLDWLSRFLHAITPTNKKYAAFSVAVLLVSGVTITYYFFTRPHVIYQYPSSEQPYQDQSQPIHIIFNKPQNPEQLEFNISTNTPGEIEWIPSFPGLPDSLQTYREMKFYPSQNILPDETFVVYLVGLQSLAGPGGVHEYNMDFTAPVAPTIVGTSIENLAEDIQVSETIDLQLNAEDYEGVEWQFEVDPPVEFEIEKKEGNLWTVNFLEELEQDTEYILTGYRTIVEKELGTGTVLSQFDSTTELSLEFRTTKPPSLESVSPKGTGVNPAEVLVLEFDEQLNKESVENALEISPLVEGEISWQDDRTLQFTPDGGWGKDTAYEIIIAAGVKTSMGGFTTEDITHDFKTAGPLQIAKISPSNGATNVSASSNITIYFDQPIRKDDLHTKLKIYPPTGGKFEWDGADQVTFIPDGNLQYNQTYTVELGAGLDTQYGLSLPKTYKFQFTTQSEIVLLNVQWYSQEERFTCNVASTRMVLAYRGIYKSELQIKNDLGVGQTLTSANTGGNPYNEWIDGYGTYWTNVHSYVKTMRNAEIKQNWSISGLLTEVDKGNPSILWWQNGWSDWYRKSWTTPGGQTIEGLNGMHSEVVIGYKGSKDNPSQIITRDPWRGTRYYSQSYFNDLWTNSFNRTAVVVY